MPAGEPRSGVLRAPGAPGGAVGRGPRGRAGVRSARSGRTGRRPIRPGSIRATWRLTSSARGDSMAAPRPRPEAVSPCRSSTSASSATPCCARRAEPVVDFDKELRTLVKDLTETMLDAPGVGLAAPQIGVGLRVFTY